MSRVNVSKRLKALKVARAKAVKELAVVARQLRQVVGK